MTTNIFRCNIIWDGCYLYCSVVPAKQNPHYTTVHSKCINDHTLRSDIFLPKNVRLIPEKCSTNLRVDTLSPTIWSDIMVGCENGYLKIFFKFLEVNMSNILWSMRICKRPFFPVCRMPGYVKCISTLHHIRARKGSSKVNISLKYCWKVTFKHP